MFEDIEVCFVDNGASLHMTRMRFVFLSLSKIYLVFFVDSGADSQLAVKGVGNVRFQIESGGFLEVDEVLFILEMKIKFFSVLDLENDGFAVVFFSGHVFLYLEGATPNTTMFLGVDMRGCIGYWDGLWLDPMDFLIHSTCQRVGRLHERES
jgi:hypothetical protein